MNLPARIHEHLKQEHPDLLAHVANIRAELTDRRTVCFGADLVHLTVLNGSRDSRTWQTGESAVAVLQERR